MRITLICFKPYPRAPDAHLPWGEFFPPSSDTALAGICDCSTRREWRQIPIPREQPGFIGEHLGSKARTCKGEKEGRRREGVFSALADAINTMR